MHKKRIVVKVGTNVMTNKDNRIVGPVLQELVRQIAYLYDNGIITVLVSSGSVIAGMELLSENTIENKEIRQQVYSAVGQPRMMRHYYTIFGNFGMRCAQVIATKRDFAPGEYRDNMVNCYEGLLSQGIIPIANEDDVTSLHKGKFSDNDELASLVAELIKADQMIILSDIDGVYNGNPEDKDSKKFSIIHVDQNIEQYIQESDKKEGEGRGGMASKLKIAKKTAAMGIPTVIARGKTNNIIVDIMEGKDVGTKFIA
ncbi:MAG TPA: glutamate 5-kinase [Sphingobacterium sp.]|nr:glutamate 5-kinase [Sphingobacterium sp.]